MSSPAYRRQHGHGRKKRDRRRRKMTRGRLRRRLMRSARQWAGFWATPPSYMSYETSWQGKPLACYATRWFRITR